MKMKKTNKQGSKSTDKLSCLPDALILHILSLVDKKIAVQSSILSKRWLNLRKYLPSFNFDDNSFPDKSSFYHFISQFLISHDATSPVHSLILHDIKEDLEESLISNLNRVLHHVVSRHIQHVDLKLCSLAGHLETYNNTISSSFLACKSLKTLKLDWFFIALSSLNLPSLKTLCLTNVTFDFHDPLVNILLRCPALEHLQLSYCQEEASEIVLITCCGLKNTFNFSSLKTLILNCIDIEPQYEEAENHPFDMFSGFVNLEDLEINSCFIYIPNGLLVISCPQLVNFKLIDAEFQFLEQAKIIFSTPRLAYFKFEMNDCVDLVLDNTTSLQIVDLHVMQYYSEYYKKWMNEPFTMFVNLFKSLSSVKSLYLTWHIIKELSLFTEMLENQICPLDNLEILKVRVSESKLVRKFQIPLEVIRYLSSGSRKLKEIDVILE